MSNIAHVVEGEASESDSDVETTSTLEKSPTKAFVVAGEAPESDDESKVSNQLELLDVDLSSLNEEPYAPPATPSRVNHSSLLHQKLWECNVSLRASVECLLKHTTELAIDKLSRSDKNLLNTQECMRATNNNLTLAKARLKQIQAGLEKASCDTALPTVNIAY